MEINFVWNIYIISLLVLSLSIIYRNDSQKIKNNYAGILIFSLYFINLFVLISYVPFLLIKYNDFSFIMFLSYYVFTYIIIKIIAKIIKKLEGDKYD